MVDVFYEQVHLQNFKGSSGHSQFIFLSSGRT